MPDPTQPTRRELLRLAALGLGALATSRGLSDQQPLVKRPAHSTTQPGSTEPPWWMKTPGKLSRVVDIRSPHYTLDETSDPATIKKLLARGLRALTDATNPKQAWSSILSNARRILIKFNSVGAATLRTTPVVATALMEHLVETGYRASDIALVEIPENLKRTLGGQSASKNWGAGIPVGQNVEPLAEYVYQADAIINVPFLKTHLIAGMSGCMKNLSHAVIRHPALYHANGCAPYVGQVIANKEVSSRLRLNIVNALRIVIRNGPDAWEADIGNHGGLLLGFDPVAVDTVGREVLQHHRREQGLAADLEVNYLESAAQADIGRHEAHELEQLVISHET
ncbi:MAG: DUF362 domain-containing protein [Planctomycetota bacterium]